MRWRPDAEGRLTQAATALFIEKGYDHTTVADIAEAAGLTKRTFFRYFTDKREVLFNGADELREVWLSGIRATPVETAPMAAVSCGLDRVATLFEDRLEFARMRAEIVSTHTDLQERELIKLQTLAGTISAALIDRGVAANTAALAAQAGVTIFHVAFGRWIQQEDPAAMKSLIAESLAELHAVTG